MKKIEQFPSSRVYTLEDLRFLKYVKEVAFKELPVSDTEKSKNLPEEIVVPLTNALQEFSERLEEFNQVISEKDDSLQNRIVEQLDKKKSDAWRDAQSYIRVMLRHPDPSIAQKAEKVCNIFDKYGELRDLSITEKGGNMHNLIDELEMIPAEDLEFLHLKPWIEHFREEVDEFDINYQNRSNIKDKIQKGVVQISKMDADMAYRQLVELVNSLIDVFGEDPFKNFVKIVNEHIFQLRALVRLRKTLREQKETDDSTPPVTEENE